MITLLVNEQKEQVQSPITIKQYLVLANIRHDRGIAVAVNNEVISKAKWENHFLQTLDKITIITATAGG